MSKNNKIDPTVACLSETLRKEDGGGFGSVVICRAKGDPLGDDFDSARKCTVEEWLLKPENQSGEWFIDGGWGGPPGPIKVKWDGEKWINKGFPPWGKIRDLTRASS